MAAELILAIRPAKRSPQTRHMWLQMPYLRLWMRPRPICQQLASQRKHTEMEPRGLGLQACGDPHHPSAYSEEVVQANQRGLALG